MNSFAHAPNRFMAPPNHEVKSALSNFIAVIVVMVKAREVNHNHYSLTYSAPQAR